MTRTSRARRENAWAFSAAGAAAAAAMLVALPAAAQQGGMELDRYRAAELPTDGFAISRPDDLGHMRFAAQLHLDYAYNPLVWELDQGDRSTQSTSVVAHHLVGNVGFAAGFADRVVVFLGLPFSLLMTGEDVAGAQSADGAALGDLYLGARARILGRRESLFSLGFQATLTAPAADAAREGQAYAGDSNFTGHAELLAEVRPGPVRITGNLGARFRPSSDLGTYVSGHELTYGLGLTVRVHRMIDLLAEAYGSSVFVDFGDRESTPFEAIGGIRVHPGAGLTIGAAAGAGIVRGVGSPAARAVLTLGWALPERAEPEREPEPAGPSDRDGDGILDDVDQCPDDPEDFDGFEDQDGCPDPDNDGDGIPDDVDQCPNDPEDLDGFEDEDGCPDPDNDGDGIPDTEDRCPNEAEDLDGFEDEDGCPDPDNDGDGVLDVEDDCPTAPGSPENRGCPVAVRVERSQIVILQRIEFETNRDRLLPSAMPILEEVRAVLGANPQIRRIRIEGHTDDRGRDEYNLELSGRRAETVRTWLVDHGIEASRLVAEGLGETRPIETNSTRAGRQANRRVEFHIVDPAPPSE